MNGHQGESVLIPTGFDPGSYSCVRSLGQRGIHTIVASEHDDIPAMASRFCDEQQLIPSAYDDLVAYKDALLGIAARSDVKTIMPLRPQDPYVFAKYADAFDQYVDLPTPDSELLAVVHDRLQLAAAAKAAGVAVPDTKLLTEVEDWSPESIVKSRYNLLTDDTQRGYTAAESTFPSSRSTFGAPTSTFSARSTTTANRWRRSSTARFAATPTPVAAASIGRRCRSPNSKPRVAGCWGISTTTAWPVSSSWSPPTPASSS